MSGDDARSAEWLPLAEAARRLGLSEKKLRKRLKRGRLDARVAAEPGPPAAAVSAAAADQALAELARLVARLQEENRTLAGQLGFTQAQLLHSREALQQAQEQLQALQAPAEPPLEHVADSTSRAEAPPAVPPRPRPRWWRFWG